jgi:hypothetical protein
MPGRVIDVTCKRCRLRVSLSAVSAGLCICGAVLGGSDGQSSAVGHHDTVAITATAAEHFELPHPPHVEAVQLPDPEFGAYPAAATPPFVPGMIRSRMPAIPYQPRSRFWGPPPIVAPPVVPQTVRAPRCALPCPTRSRMFGPPVVAT